MATLPGFDVDVRPYVVNVASVPQRSPFRYPGGKTWLVPQFRAWIRSLPRRPRTLVEPFAGGGVISLTAVMEHLVDRVVMADIDPDISVVWNVILRGDHEALSRRITGFEISREAVIHQLSNPPKSDLDRAFNTILRNRVQRGGILAPGASLVRSGENGKGVASRWYPTTLARRIEAIASVRERIEFVSADGLDLICSLTEDPEVVFFVDPPYTAGGKKAGKRLYAFNELDHSRLFALLGQSKGPALITYDDAPEPLLLAQSHGFSVERTAMSNTHHSTMLELLITSPGRPHPATA